MATTSGTPRTGEPAPSVFEPRTNPRESRPGSAPVATTIVLFAVVAALLGFIAWL
ncbi:MAG: hypothetical protein NTY35_05240 [Planctomycetota bacterium]|nr:hypothetical protein [Planctomycetota bacterium]